jgi:isopentenyl diphosphate isomerase/L-lactate dehydrogenase-like FMN-dependent dehydrogenase
MNTASVPSILELRRLARARLPRFVWDAIEGGDAGRLAARAGSEALEGVRFTPRILAGAARPAQKTTLMGLHYDGPLALALPPGGEMAGGHVERDLWRAARMANLPFVLPAAALRLLAPCVRECGSAPWLEVCVSRDHTLMRDILAQARQSGCEVLVLSTGTRACAPPVARLRKAADALLHPRWLCQALPPALARGDLRPRASAGDAPWRARPDWRDLMWLRAAWHGKLVLKGVLRPDDARLAVQLGADGLIVCDGGGQPGSVAALDMLPRIAAAAGGQTAILAEGDLCSGMDVVKALALGADMALVGKAALYGVAAGSQAGAERALQLLRAEIESVLTLIGCASTAALGPAFLARPRNPATRRAPVPGELPPGVLRFQPRGSGPAFSRHR